MLANDLWFYGVWRKDSLEKVIVLGLDIKLRFMGSKRTMIVIKKKVLGQNLKPQEHIFKKITHEEDL